MGLYISLIGLKNQGYTTHHSWNGSKVIVCDSMTSYYSTINVSLDGSTSDIIVKYTTYDTYEKYQNQEFAFFEQIYTFSSTDLEYGLEKNTKLKLNLLDNYGGTSVSMTLE